MNKRNKVLFTVFALVMTSSLIFSGVLRADTEVVTASPGNIGGGQPSLQDQLNDLQSQIDAIQNEKNSIQDQINTNQYLVEGYNSQLSKLYGEVIIYQKSIEELQLQIKELEVGIQVLEQQIEEKRAEIKKTEGNIGSLEVESDFRIKNSYMNYKLYSGETGNDNLFNIDNVNKYFKDSQYKEIIQSDTNDLLTELARLKQELKDKKKELDDKLVQMKKEKELIDIQYNDLAKKKQELDAKMSVFYAKVAEAKGASAAFQARMSLLTDEEMKVSAQAELIKQQIMLSFVTTGEYVLAGTIIGFQGCSGYCFGEHLHFSVYVNGASTNPCGQLESGGMGCGTGGPLKSPLRGSTAFNSGYGWRQFDNSFHDGIDVTDYQVGAPVYAAHDGYIQRGVDCWHRDMGYPTNGCANYVKIAQNRGSNAGYVTGYWHLK